MVGIFNLNKSKKHLSIPLFIGFYDFQTKKVQTFTIYTLLCHYLLTITLQLTYRFTFCKLQGEGTRIVLTIVHFIGDIVRYMLDRLLEKYVFICGMLLIKRLDIYVLIKWLLIDVIGINFI